MKRSRWLIPLIIILLIAAVIVVGLQVRNQQTGKELSGTITLKSSGQEIEIPISDLDRESFSGETVNGKGEHFNSEYRGVELQELLKEQGIPPESVTKVKAAAADQYTAAYSGDEVRVPGKLYLAVEVDGEAIRDIEGDDPGVQMIVFGDPDSRRLVRSLVTLEVL